MIGLAWLLYVIGAGASMAAVALYVHTAAPVVAVAAGFILFAACAASATDW